jgi:uncharacterized protein YehS (DUF1456 family)
MSMDNNDTIRRLRYALNITDLKIAELYELAGRPIEKPLLEGNFKKEEEPGYEKCDDGLMSSFLDGLIISRRGKKEPSGPDAPKARARLSNNDILRSIRIALQLKDDDIIAIMGLAGIEVSKSELSALFRKHSHPNYRPCGDQFLRNFLVGLTTKYRG